jgi:cell division protein FtsX
MPTDELRGELTTLADEIEPFAGDVRAVHRRVRSRRIITAALVAAVVVVVAVSSIAVAGHRDAGKVNITGTGSKEVSAVELGPVDVIIVPAITEVKKELEASPLVAHYAVLARGRRISAKTSGDPHHALCALESNDGFAVQASVPGSGIGPIPSSDLAGQATAYSVTDAFGFDIEVFLKVGASPQQVESVRAALAADRDVRSTRYIDQTDAYAIFKREFVDQPLLIAGTKPAELPASFRVILEPGVSQASAATRFNGMPGVDTVISRERNLTPIPNVSTGDIEKFLNGRRAAELFLAVGASTAQADAVRTALADDPNVDSFHFIDQEHAYAIFKTDFADQPGLVQTTKPSDLPASFRITVKIGLSAPDTLARYKHLDGVERIITAEDSATGLAAMFASACTNPK